TNNPENRSARATLSRTLSQHVDDFLFVSAIARRLRAQSRSIPIAEVCTRAPRTVEPDHKSIQADIRGAFA
uniref:hypothetical protein n=1 Tax=Klebsiella pneumoniae TaxID=573 RepID=UPI00195455F7